MLHCYIFANTIFFQCVGLGLFCLILDHHHEISGSNARLTLLRLRCYLEGANIDYRDAKTKRLLRLIANLSHIQDLAYATESRRTSANMLAMHNLTYVFSLDYVKVLLSQCQSKQLTTSSFYIITT